MAWRLYAIPIETTTRPGGGAARGPKYFTWKYDPDPPALMAGVPWSMMDYGAEPTAIVAANVTTAQHNTLAAQEDVLAVPSNLNSSPTAAQANVARNYLEGLNIPSGWLTTSLTWRQIMRVVCGMFQFVQRYEGISGGARLFPESGVDLARTYGSLPEKVQTDLFATANSFEWDTSGLTANTTLRTILEFMGRQWGSEPFYLGGFVL